VLVLSRRVGEEVVIADNIRLAVVAIRGKSVRLGFTAPADVLIRREELCSPPADPGPVPGSPATDEVQP
jgi:carbon storage regulator